MYGVLLKKSIRERFSFDKKRADVSGALLSLLLTAALLFAAVTVISNLSVLYADIEMDGIADRDARVTELLSFIYAVIFVIGVGDGIKNINFALFENEDRKILMTLPVKSSTIFYSKLTSVYVRQLFAVAVMLIPVNIAMANAAEADAVYIGMTILAIPLFPGLTLLASSILCFPVYILKRMLKSKYLISLILATAVLALLFYGYKYILEFIRELFTTGNIRFFFDDDVMNFMIAFNKYAYPVNLIAKLMIGAELTKNILILCAVTVAAFAAGFGVVALLYNKVQLMRASSSKHASSSLKRAGRRKSVFSGLFAKEFFQIYRTPSYAFQYFSVAVIMPLMVYFCMGIGEDLLKQLIMADASAELGLFLVLTFGALTNTFSATNISRDGYAFYTLKAMPVKPSMIINVKVLFSAMIAVLSILVSAVVLVVAEFVTVGEATYIFFVALFMALAQIAFATGKDLRHPSFSAEEDNEVRESTQTVSQIIILGLLTGLILGGGSLFVSVFLSGVTPVAESYVKAGSLVLSAIIAALSFVYLYKGLPERLYNMSEGEN